MTEKTLAELQAEQAVIELQIEALEVAPLQAITAAFDDPAFAAALSAVSDNLDNLTGERRQQAQNIIQVLGYSPGFLEAQLAEIQSRLVPPV